MTTALAFASPGPDDELNSWSDEQLKAEFLKQASVTVGGLRRMAACYRVLQIRGISIDASSVPELRSLFDQIRLIANGQALPEVIVRFIGMRQLQKAITSLPIPDQKKIAAGEPVKVVVRTPSGEMTNRMIDPINLGGKQIRQVFDHGRIRDEAEQIAMLERETPPTPPTDLLTLGSITIDRKRDGLIIGGKFVGREEVEAALRELPTRKRK